LSDRLLELCAATGGAIDVESQEGKGTTFITWLPIKE